MESITFSKLLKEELSNLKIEKEDERIAQLHAAIQSSSSISINMLEMQMEIKLNNAKIAKSCIETIKKNYSYVDMQIIVQKMKKFKKSKTIYIISIARGVKQLLFDLKLINSKDVNFIFSLNNVLTADKDENYLKVYIRTFWILNGTINDPKKQSQYHLEIVSTNIERLKEIKNIVTEYDIFFKISKRKSNYPLYLNKSEEIADFLKYIGSINGLFEFEDLRITRDFRNTNNRMNNAEIANEIKRQKTSSQQIEAIHKLFERKELERLNEKTKLIAKLRLENPDMTLAELSKLTNNKISKSNISYHLNNIIKLSKGE